MKSGVWAFFDLERYPSGKSEAICCTCQKAFNYSGGTSTLWRHVRGKHDIPEMPPKSFTMKTDYDDDENDV